MSVDLHTHTTASDGQYRPAELVELARRARLTTLAITDHDTVGGIDEALGAASTGRPLLIVPGIELSAEDDRGDVHVLGYFIDHQHDELRAHLNAFNLQRTERAWRILDRLAALGAPVARERVQALAAGGVIGRPHIARALVETGAVDSVGEAFSRYLYTGGPAYVARERLSPREAIAVIHAAGGAAVLAHPGIVPDYAELIAELAACGLDGVEVAHPQNDGVARANLAGLARKYGLIMTGGSDFHGPAIKPGIALGMVTPPPGCVKALRERADNYRERSPG